MKRCGATISTLAACLVSAALVVQSVSASAAGFCVQLEHGHSTRVRTAAEELLVGELRRRAGRNHAGDGVDVVAMTRHWQVAAAPDACPTLSTIVTMAVVGASPQDNACRLPLGNDQESFLICTDPQSRQAAAPTLQLHARGDRGLMLGVGRLLRALDVSAFGEVSIPHDLSLTVEPPPFGRMRGHQLTDWGFYMTTEFFEQYAKELLVFGTNQVEFAHIDYTRGDQYKLVAWSAILDKYDLRVSVFNAPYSTDSDKATTREVFANMTRVDSLFREGGGAETFPDMQELVAELHKHHPNATVWLSPCGLDEMALDQWLLAMDAPTTRSWLHGVAYGPGVHISQKQVSCSLYLTRSDSLLMTHTHTHTHTHTQLVERLPSGYELRQYPDITHSLAAMYPQPNWCDLHTQRACSVWSSLSVGWCVCVCVCVCAGIAHGPSRTGGW